MDEATKERVREAADGLGPENRTALTRLGGSKIQQFRNALVEFRPDIEAALMGRIDADHFIEVAITALLNPESKLAEVIATPDGARSALVALRKSAQLNLRPDGEEGALIPRGGKVYFEPMYKGLARTLLRTGMYSKAEARMARTGDHFKHQLGLAPMIEHIPGPPSTRGDFEWGYAIVWHRLSPGEVFDPSRHTQFEVMHIEELQAIRATSKKQNKGKEGPAWRQQPGEMYRKIPLKRLAKFLELDVEQAAVFRYSDAIDSGNLEVEPGEFIPEVEFRTLDERVTAHHERQTQDLRDRVNATSGPSAFLDRKLGRGKHAKLTWRQLVEQDRPYVRMGIDKGFWGWIDEEQIEVLRSYADEVKAASSGEPQQDESEPGAGEFELMKERAIKVAVALAKKNQLTMEESEEGEVLAHDGNLAGLRDWVEEMERRLENGRALDPKKKPPAS